MSWTSRVATAAAALLICSDAQAQMPSINITVGPTSGARTVNQPAFESDPMLSVGGGAGFRFGSGSFAFEPQVLIVSKASKQRVGENEERLKLDYIEFPALGMVTIGRSARIHPFVAAGPVVGLEMRCRVEFVDGNSKEEVACDMANSATFDRHKVDLSITGVIGAEYNLSPTRKVALQARYTHGMRNLSDAEDASLEIYNRALSFYVSYLLPLKPDF